VKHEKAIEEVTQKIIAQENSTFEKVTYELIVQEKMYEEATKFFPIGHPHKVQRLKISH
jgi:hypothetical protein